MGEGNQSTRSKQLKIMGAGEEIHLHTVVAVGCATY